jgi:hypothetical protein
MKSHSFTPLRHAVVVVVLLAALIAAGGERANGAGYWGQGYRICRSLSVESGPLYVSAKNVRCRKAVRIIREWWKGPDSRQTFVEDSTGGHVLLDRFPGWVCADGASAGGCHKGNRHAVYNFFEPRVAPSFSNLGRAGPVSSCPSFHLGRLTFASIERQRHIRCGLVRRLLRGTYRGCGYRESWPFHTADGTPYGRPTCWFRRGWRCSTGAGGAVCWSATRPELNAIPNSGRPLAITVEVR